MYSHTETVYQQHNKIFDSVLYYPLFKNGNSLVRLVRLVLSSKHIANDSS